MKQARLFILMTIAQIVLGTAMCQTSEATRSGSSSSWGVPLAVIGGIGAVGNLSYSAYQLYRVQQQQKLVPQKVQDKEKSLVREFSADYNSHLWYDYFYSDKPLRYRSQNDFVFMYRVIQDIIGLIRDEISSRNHNVDIAEESRFEENNKLKILQQTLRNEIYNLEQCCHHFHIDFLKNRFLSYLNFELEWSDYNPKSEFSTIEYLRKNIRDIEYFYPSIHNIDIEYLELKYKYLDAAPHSFLQIPLFNTNMLSNISLRKRMDALYDIRKDLLPITAEADSLYRDLDKKFQNEYESILKSLIRYKKSREWTRRRDDIQTSTQIIQDDFDFLEKKILPMIAAAIENITNGDLYKLGLQKKSYDEKWAQWCKEKYLLFFSEYLNIEILLNCKLKLIQY